MSTAVPVPAALPTPAAEEHGVLIAGSRTPLTLMHCTIDVDVAGPAAEVSLSWTYLNESGKDVDVMAALPAPTGWTIVDGHIAYDQTEMRGCFDVAGQDSAAHTGLDVPATALALATTCGGTATASLPFPIAVGTRVRVGAVYLVPMRRPVEALTRAVSLTLPAELIPRVQRPPSAVTAFHGVFALLNQRRLEPVLRVRVAAHMHVALRGEVQLVATRAGDNGSQEVVPLEGAVSYHGDAAFSLEFTAPLPGAESAEPASAAAVHSDYRGGPLIIQVGVQDTVEPLRVFVQAASNEEVGSAITTTLTPVDLEAKTGGTVNTEYIFVVSSHSPATSTAIARALRIALRALPSSAHVNVVVMQGNGNDRDKDAGRLLLFPRGSPAAGEVRLDDLHALIDEMNPQPRPQRGAGLTETLLDLLPERYRAKDLLPPLPGHLRHLIILADDATPPASTPPATTAALLQAVWDSRASCRLSAVPITADYTAADQHPASSLALLQLLAREGSGLFVEAAQPAEVAAALGSVLAATAVPTLVEVRLRVEAGGGSAKVSHAHPPGEPMPAIPSGSQLTAYALAAAGAGSVSVHATGRVGEHVVEFMGTGREGPTVGGGGSHAGSDPLTRAAAAACVKGLLADGGTPCVEAVRLSKAASVPCPPTTRLVLHAEKGGQAWSPVLVGGAAALAIAHHTEVLSEWDALRRRWAAVLAGRRAEPMAAAPRGECSRDGTSAVHRTAEVFARAAAAEVPAAAAALSPSVERVLELQERTGGWRLCPALAEAVGRSLDAIEVAEPVDETDTPKKQMSEQKRCAWATVVAIGFLEARAEPVAALAIRTARQYLRQSGGYGEKLRSHLGVARGLFDGSTAAPL